jgi:hypothetical protein
MTTLLLFLDSSLGEAPFVEKGKGRGGEAGRRPHLLQACAAASFILTFSVNTVLLSQYTHTHTVTGLHPKP